MLQFFDIEAYLQDNNIPYSEHGEKNVAQGWIGISCFSCGDTSNHLGINLNSKIISCWRCGYKSSAFSIIMHYENCTYAEAVAISKKTQEYSSTPYIKKAPEKNLGEDILPKSASLDIPDRYVSFLKSRRFTTEIIKKYKLRACGTIGEYKYRLIIPIFIDNEIVSFTSLDTTGRSSIKYKHSSIKNSIIPVKDCVYGLDFVGDRMLLVEGITDMWRMGPGSVATMGMELSKSQINFISQAPQKEIFIMFDGEAKAIENAHKLAQTLSMQGKYTEVIELSHGDPDDLTTNMVKHLRSELGL